MTVLASWDYHGSGPFIVKISLMSDGSLTCNCLEYREESQWDPIGTTCQHTRTVDRMSRVIWEHRRAIVERKSPASVQSTLQKLTEKTLKAFPDPSKPKRSIDLED